MIEMIIDRCSFLWRGVLHFIPVARLETWIAPCSETWHIDNCPPYHSGRQGAMRRIYCGHAARCK